MKIGAVGLEQKQVSSKNITNLEPQELKYKSVCNVYKRRVDLVGLPHT